MPQQNISSYNSLISSYIHMGLYYNAISGFLDAINDSNVKADKIACALALNDCAKSNDLVLGSIVHGLVVVDGFLKKAFLTNSVIDMHVKCGRMDAARRVFDGVEELDVVLWNSMVAGYEKVGAREEAVRVFVGMRRVGVELNMCAVGSVLKACGRLDWLVLFSDMIHGCVVKAELDSDVVVGSAMIDTYVKNGMLGEVIKFFRLLSNRNAVVFNVMITGFSKLEEGTPNELVREGLNLFTETQREGIRPSKFMFTGI